MHSSAAVSDEAARVLGLAVPSAHGWAYVTIDESRPR
jgi:hypothetical protein